MRSNRFYFVALCILGTLPLSAAICPTTSSTNTDCAFILTIGPGGSGSLVAVPNARPYDGSEDTLVGIVNNSGGTFSGSFTLTNKGSDIFGLDGDGICSYISGTPIGAYCATAATGYEGPGVTFSNISPTYDSGTINISALAPGGSTFFSLEGSPSQVGGDGGVPTISGGGSGLTASSVNLGTIPLGSPISASISVFGGTPPYTITPPANLPPGLTLSGTSVSGTPTQPGNYTLQFQVTDLASTGATGTVTFSVMGLTAPLPAGIVFSPYLYSVGAAGGTPPYTFGFQGLPAGISGNAGGVLQGIVTKPVTSAVTVTVTDNAAISVSKALQLSFAAPPALSVSPSALPAAAVGQTYSQILAGASGGVPPYIWSLSAGAMPDGLVLRPGGTIAGIPTRPGPYTFSVRATDNTGASAVGQATLTIAPSPLTILAPPLPSGMATVEYPPQVVGITGGTPPYSVVLSDGTTPKPAIAGSLPRAATNMGGLTLDSTGVLRGIPTAPGSYSFTISALDSAGVLANATMAFTIRPLSTDLLLTGGSADFTLVAGTQSLPTPQIIGVQSSNPLIVLPYSVSVAPSTATWLTVTQGGGATPAVLSVALNSQALLLLPSQTPYQATISVACQAPAPCAGSAQTIAVTLTVTSPPPQLNVTTDLLSFSAAPGQGTNGQALGVQNAGGGTIGIASVSCAATWCTAGSPPGSILAGQTLSIPVTIDTSSLAAGYYRTTLTVTTSAGTVILPVTALVTSSPGLLLSPAGAQFQSLAGGQPNGPLTSFLVNTSASAPIGWSATVLPGANWLTVLTPSGIASSSQPGQVAFRLDPTGVAALAPQTYYGVIRINALGAFNSLQDFLVVLNVGPANGIQRPNPSPAGLLFLTQGTTPPPQIVTVTTNSVNPAATQLSVSTTDGTNWLTATPATGTAQPGNALQTQVSVNPSKLSPGIYYGGVNYAFGSLGVRTVNVTLIVSPPIRPTDRPTEPSLSAVPAAAGCTPSQLGLAQVGLVSSFSQPAAWPTPLEVFLLNDCGDPLPNGQIVATFSNGDPPIPLNLADPKTGLFTGTWIPRKAAQQTTITMRATAQGFAPVTSQMGGTVSPNAAPLLARNSTQHIFNPLPGGALAPGNLIQISGSALSSKAVTAPAGALPATLNSVQVLIGGLPAPLSQISPGTLTAELPFGLAPGGRYQVVVSANGALTVPDSIQLVGTSPGVSITSAGLANATHANGTPVTKDAPAAPGEALALVAAGLGLTDTPISDGAVTPATPQIKAVSVPSLTIDGTAAAVSFAGLQPGLVGIYQVLFIVPGTAKNGDLTLVLSQDGQPGNSAILPVRAPTP